jgi:hypothetical protein
MKSVERDFVKTCYESSTNNHRSLMIQATRLPKDLIDLIFQFTALNQIEHCTHVLLTDSPSTSSSGITTSISIVRPPILSFHGKLLPSLFRIRFDSWTKDCYGETFYDLNMLAFVLMNKPHRIVHRAWRHIAGKSKQEINKNEIYARSLHCLALHYQEKNLTMNRRASTMAKAKRICRSIFYLISFGMIIFIFFNAYNA